MRLKLSHIPYIADKIALDIGAAHFIEILTNRGDIIKIASKHLEENILQEQSLHEKAHNLLDQSVDESVLEGLDYNRMLRMVKRRFAEESGFILAWEERYNALSHKIMDELIDTSVINFRVSESMVKNVIFKSIDSYARAYRGIEREVEDRIKNYKKKLNSGTEEYELVFSKMFEQELRRQGLI